MEGGGVEHEIEVMPLEMCCLGMFACYVIVLLEFFNMKCISNKANRITIILRLLDIKMHRLHHYFFFV